MTIPEERCTTIVGMSDDWSEPVACGESRPGPAHPWPKILEEGRQDKMVRK